MYETKDMAIMIRFDVCILLAVKGTKCCTASAPNG
jgi:hypothetical protein